MKKIVITVLTILATYNLFATPEYEVTVFELPDYSATPIKAVRNGNDFYLLGESVPNFNTDSINNHQFIIAQFRYTGGKVKKIRDKRFNEDERLRVSNKSACLYYDDDGLRVYSNAYKYGGIYTQYYLLEDFSIVEANIDTESNFNPLYKDIMTPLFCINGSSVRNVFIDSNPKSPNPFDLVYIDYDEQGNYVSDNLFLSTNTDSGLITKDSLMNLLYKNDFIIEFTSDDTYTLYSDISYGIGDMATGVKNYNDGLLTFLDSINSIKWSVLMSEAMSDDGEFLSIQSLRKYNSEIIAVGECKKSNTIGLNKYQIAKFNAESGKLLKESIYFKEGEFLEINDIWVDADKIIISGNSRKTKASIRQSYIAQFDSELNLVWEIYEQPSEGIHSNIQEIIELEKGEYWGYGYAYNEETKHSDF